jgi:hypothetical protein
MGVYIVICPVCQKYCFHTNRVSWPWCRSRHSACTHTKVYMFSHRVTWYVISFMRIIDTQAVTECRTLVWSSTLVACAMATAAAAQVQSRCSGFCWAWVTLAGTQWILYVYFSDCICIRMLCMYILYIYNIYIYYICIYNIYSYIYIYILYMYYIYIYICTGRTRLLQYY